MSLLEIQRLHGLALPSNTGLGVLLSTISVLALPYMGNISF